MEGKPVGMEELLAKTGSIYKLVVLASKRAQELSEGSAKLTEDKSDKPILIALHEIAEGKIYYKAEGSK
ncbi:MAG: DNA-directed RNA polymerase subunit omega [Candidatus Omnitrophota bacterium]